ncbi:MAG: transporter substrate-binding domain-containing protein [Spirochaetales bacterium]|nr:transporter substrate-binding domain-containing protein [Spirochaetales bacterium]
MKSKLTILIIFIAACLSAQEQEIDVVRWGVEEWEGFTDEDGLYTQLMMRIFEEKGIELDIQYYPFSRTLYLTQVGYLDFAGGISGKNENNRTFYLSRYPIYINRYRMLYNKKSLTAPISLESIKGKKIACTPDIGTSLGLREGEFLVVTTRDQAIRMVLSGRIDIFADQEEVFLASLEEFEAEINKENFGTHLIPITDNIHMVSTGSERGRRIMDLYDEGIRDLASTGELERIYSSMGFIAPEIEEVAPPVP